MEGNEGR